MLSQSGGSHGQCPGCGLHQLPLRHSLFHPASSDDPAFLPGRLKARHILGIINVLADHPESDACSNDHPHLKQWIIDLFTTKFDNFQYMR